MTNAPKLEEMLKLYSKKDLWAKIQEKNKIIEELDHKIEILEKTLELAVADKCKVENFIAEILVGKDALEKAEKELEGE